MCSAFLLALPTVGKCAHVLNIKFGDFNVIYIAFSYGILVRRAICGKRRNTQNYILLAYEGVLIY